MRRLGLASLGLLVLMLGAMGCNSDGGDDGAVVSSDELNCDDGDALAANTVGLRCGSQVGPIVRRVRVVLEGPETGVTIYRGLSFDIRYDPTKVACAVSNGEVAAEWRSPFPGALKVASLLNGQQGQVVVSIQLPQDQPSFQLDAGELKEILSLRFELVPSQFFTDTPVDLLNTDATGSNPAISFETSAAAVHLSYP